MTIRDVVDEALRTLEMDRRRAALSSIGVVVGTATVVATLAIGEGARRAAVAEIGALGIDNVLLRSRRLEATDLNRITRRLAGVRAAALSWEVSANVRGDVGEVHTAILAVSPAFTEVGNIRVTHGRWLLDADMKARRRVAVIGEEHAQTLFGQTEAIGRSLWISGDWYRVVGTAAATRAFVPLSTAETSWSTAIRNAASREIAVRVSADDALPAAEIIRTPTFPDTSVIVPRELLDARLRAQRTFTIVLVAIGTLALVISGVGIMNVMLASVAERTAELGVRRAVGAPRSAIVLQVATESTVLCVAGGCVGLPLGIAFAMAVAWLANWPIAVSVAALSTAIALAAVTGIGFGLYPARAAARISPVDAMRAT